MARMTIPETAELPPFDKYYHYTDAFQNPKRDVRFLQKVYREARGRKATPRTLREDFCGTFANCCAWVQLDDDRRAIGVDSDAEALAYGRDNYLPKLTPEQQARVRTLRKSARGRGLPKADLIAVLNYSYFVFKTRPDLVAYFRSCFRTLEPDGVLVLDCCGGPLYQFSDDEDPEEYEGDGYTYFFEQESFEPLKNEARFSMHVQLPDEELREKVFTFDWRVWTVPELKDALSDAGFAEVRIYWEGTAPDGSGEGKYYRMERANEEPESWICYVVALR